MHRAKLQRSTAALPERIGIGRILIALVFFLTGCVGIPDAVSPVGDFQLERYLGQWYEIARLDHSFERGLTRVTANYSLRPDGGVRVLNRGYSTSENAWKEAEGKAYLDRLGFPWTGDKTGCPRRLVWRRSFGRARWT